ncbi:MAG: FHA domain-containing protein [Nitrospiraceae bacterium]|nr:MAG: FHA domain-containing protein [Nitrospiraceae bacterium]
MDLSLNIMTGNRSVEEHFLSGPVTFIGRTSDNDIILPDKNVSKKHAKITCTEDLVEIHDLGSTNGVFVNNKRIHNRCHLQPGDIIRIGQTNVKLSTRDDELLTETHILHQFSPEIEHNLDHKKLQALYDITTDLTGNLDIGILGEKIFSTLRGIFSQDRGYLALFNSDGALHPVCSEPPGKQIPLSRSIVNRMFRSGESLLFEDAIHDAALREEESILSLKVRSALCVPLIYNSQILGLIYLDQGVPGAYSQDDLDFFRSIGSLLAPLIENARLWSELKKRYKNTVETLKKTESSLIEAERTAAYVRLAHAMAHEIRNPVMVIGGLVRKISKCDNKNINDDVLQAIISSVNRVETVLKEVDSFVKIPAPVRKLQKLDDLVQEQISSHSEQFSNNSLTPVLKVNTSHVLIPIDSELIRKALSMILEEIFFSGPRKADMIISIDEDNNDIRVTFGDISSGQRLCKPFDPEIRDKPWSLGLFLNIAHKILSDHGGCIMLSPTSHTAFPIVMKVPKSIDIDTSVK